mgnify:CR=1 FL=1
MTWKDILKRERFIRDKSRTEEETIKELKRIYPEAMELLENMDFEEYFKFPEEENIKVGINPDNRPVNKYNMFSDFERSSQIMHVKMGKVISESPRKVRNISMILSTHPASTTWYWEFWTYDGDEFLMQFDGMNNKDIYNEVLEVLNKGD